MSSTSMAKCSSPKCAEELPGASVSPVRASENVTSVPPSASQRMNRSPNGRVWSLRILKANALTHHSAALRGSDALMWM
jgi:hypothetical protein